MNFYKSQDEAERMATLKTAEALSHGLAITYKAVSHKSGWFKVQIVTANN
jgi:hypothetical protein